MPFLRNFISLLLFVFRLHWRLLLTIEDELVKTLTSKSTYCHFFNISSGKATCKICKVSFSYDQQKRGPNSLRRHLATKHSKALNAKDSAGKTDESQGSLVESGFVSVTKRPKLELSPKTRYILTLACSRHVLPL